MAATQLTGRQIAPLDLTVEVGSSVLPVANGGTGAATLTGVAKGNGTSAFSAAAAGTDFVAPGGALGTPSSGTLTNCTGLPLTSLVDDTATAVGVGTIELGHASDTTLGRSAAGVATVEGERVMTCGQGTVTSSATPTINTGRTAFYFYSLTAQAVDITNMSTNLTGTRTVGDRLWIAITGTAARAITWGSLFVAGAVALPTTTVGTQRLDAAFIWDGADYRCMASGSG